MKRPNSSNILKSAAFSALLIAFTTSGAWAASKTAGSIYGHAPVAAGETVVVTNIETGFTRTVAVGNDGYYHIGALSPGQYRVDLVQNGAVAVTRNATVQVGVGTNVALTTTAQNLGTIQVTGGAINPIDVSSTNTSLVLNSAEFEQLPVPRDITSVALLAPGTVHGSPNFGFGVSFGGSSIAENAYYLDGLNVTNMQEFLSFAVPPFEGLEQYQVLTGGYGATYGNALGGVVNMVVKSGGNQFHAGANAYWVPPGLRSKGPRRTLPDGTIYIHDRRDVYSDLKYNLYGSGPIIKDHLFFYALYQGEDYNDELYGVSTSWHDEINNPQGLLKLDWNINGSNRLTFTGYSTAHQVDEVIYDLDPAYSTTRVGTTGTLSTDEGSRAYIGKYTGAFTDNFTMTALYGYVYFDRGSVPSGADCPYAYDGRNPDLWVRLGCWSTSYLHPKANNSHRHQYRVDFDWQIGPHNVTFGYDHQDFVTQYHIHYSGGHYWLYQTAEPGATLANGAVVPPGVTQVVRKRVFTEGGTFEDIGDAAYIQDKWRIGNWYVRLGLRDSRIDSKNGTGQTYIKFDNEIAPRLGFSWDVNGDGSLKVYGDLGRYFIPIPTNESVITAGARSEWIEYYTFSGIDPKTGAPIDPQELGNRKTVADGKVRSPKSVAAWNLESMSNDELILGAQKRIGDSQWSVGIRGIRRVLVNGEEDTCQSEGFAKWAADNNYADTALDAPTCIIVNPGSDVGDYVDIDGDGKLEKVTIPNKYFGLPDMERYYNAVELLFERAFDGKWFLNGSLTWSHNYGNAQGYVKPATGQEEAGTTTNFDHTEWTYGAYGNLPADRRWVFKVFGAYNFTPEWRVGFNVLIHSGMPISCLGSYPNPEAPGGGRAITHYCDGVLVPQGSVGRTPRIYRLDASLQYSPDWAPGLKVGLSVFNVFNSHHATHVNETYDNGINLHDRLESYLYPDAFQTFRYARVSIEYDWM
ncbi:MAG TPA: TonB-dependent receptor [Gammaproteobacteria bacterium]|nr:TonB-dependent receptor [Gammaproteobacteria bacterium]